MTTKRKYLTAAERRETIVKTVIQLAGEQNPSEITTAAIAKRMGLTQGALFRHFLNKAAILQAVMEWVGNRLISRIEKASATDSSTISALENIFMTHIDFITRHPGIPRMLFGELQRAEQTGAKAVVQHLILRYRAVLNRLFEQGKASGELNPKLDIEAAITLFIGTIQGLVIQSLLSGDVEKMRPNALSVFAVYQEGIRRAE